MHKQTAQTWIVCIGGFTQSNGEPTGMFKLWRKLAKFRSPDVCVCLREWNSDWNELAEMIWLASGEVPGKVAVIIFAYSYGSGWGFIQLAKRLAQRGLFVCEAVLSDPVYRSRWLTMGWRSLVGKPVIRVPKNVGLVHWFRQMKDKPRGHDLAASGNTAIMPAEILVRGHRYMDDAPKFHDKCLQVAGEWC